MRHNLLPGFFKTILLIIFGFIQGDAIGQYSPICSEAMPICDVTQLDGKMFQLSDPDDYNMIADRLEEIPNCLQGNSSGNSFKIQNPYWFYFVATKTTISFQIESSNCTLIGNTDKGFQFAIIQDCEELNVISCDANQNDGIVDFSDIGFIVGQEYYLVIDGYGGSVCDVVIRNIDGIGTNSFGTIDQPQISGFNNDTICAGIEDVNISIPSSSGADLSGYFFLWRITNTTTNINVLDTVTTGSILTYSFYNEGDFEITAYAYNACAISNTVTKLVNISRIADQVLDPYTFCIEDLSDTIPDYPDDIRFLGLNPITFIPVNDTVVYSIVDSKTCHFNQLVPLDPVFMGARQTVDTAICGMGALSYYGREFTMSEKGVMMTLDNQASTGCDSLVMLNVYLLEIKGVVEASSCSESDATIQFFWESDYDPIDLDEVSYKWIDPQGNELVDVDNDGKINVTQNGQFSLTIVVGKGKAQCTSSLFTINVSNSVNTPELVTDCTLDENSNLLINWNDYVNIAYYAIVQGGDTIDRVNVSNWMKNNIQAGEDVQYDIVVVFGNSCPSISKPTNCDNNVCPEATVEIIGPDEVCTSDISQGVSYTLAIENNTNMLLVGQWGSNINPDGILILPDSASRTVDISYDYKIGSCSFHILKTIQINETPKIEVNVLESICDESSFNIDINIEGEYSPFTTYLDDNVLNTLVVEDLTEGLYTIRTVDAKFCGSSKDIVLTPSIVQPMVSGRADIAEPSENSYQLINIENRVIKNIEWFYNEVAICNESACQEIINYKADTSGVLCADVLFDDDCSQVYCLSIQVKSILKRPFIPNIFSPSLVNKNGLFTVEVFQTGVTLDVVDIFDRWGNMIYSQQSTGNDGKSMSWDGSLLNNNESRPGVYFYIVEVHNQEGQKAIFKGDVTLIR